MLCVSCQKEIPDNSTLCPLCGSVQSNTGTGPGTAHNTGAPGQSAAPQPPHAQPGQPAIPAPQPPAGNANMPLPPMGASQPPSFNQPSAPVPKAPQTPPVPVKPQTPAVQPPQAPSMSPGPVTSPPQAPQQSTPQQPAPAPKPPAASQQSAQPGMMSPPSQAGQSVPPAAPGATPMAPIASTPQNSPAPPQPFGASGAGGPSIETPPQGDGLPEISSSTPAQPPTGINAKPTDTGLNVPEPGATPQPPQDGLKMPEQISADTPGHGGIQSPENKSSFSMNDLASMQNSAEEIPAKPEPVQIEAQDIFCNICGAKNKSSMTECEYCKSPLVTSAAQTTSPELQPPPEPEDEELPPDLDITQSEFGMESQAGTSPPTPETPAAEPVPAGKSGKICPGCSTENPDMMVICYSCGESLDAPPKSSTPSEPQPSGVPTPAPFVPSLDGQKPQDPPQAPPSAPPIPGPPAEPAKEKKDTKPFLLCPKCYFRNDIHAESCKQCGNELKKKSAEPPSSQEEGGENTCPMCGTKNPKEIISCSNCNYNFLKKKKDEITVEPPKIDESKKVVCPRCSTDNTNEDKHCRVCGEKLIATVKMPKYDPSKAAPPPPGGPPGASAVPQPPASPSAAPVSAPQGQSVPPPPGGAAQPAGNPPPLSGGAGTPPPPPGIQPASTGGPSAQPMGGSGYVPDWKNKKGSKPQQPAGKEFGTPPKMSKKGMMIGFGIIAGLILIALLYILFGGGSETKPSKIEPKPTQPISTPVTANQSGSTQTDDIGEVRVVTEEDAQLQELQVAEEAENQIDSEEQGEELVTKGLEALKANRVTSPRNRNAYYYFIQAKNQGYDSADFIKLQNELNSKLHRLGDSSMGDKRFDRAERYYDMALKVDPDDDSVPRKKRQLRDLKAKDEKERVEFQRAIQSGSIQQIENAIDKYPRSQYVGQAREEIRNLKRLREDARQKEAARIKAQKEREAYLNKQYVFNVVHKYFLGENRGKLVFSRKSIAFQPVDNRDEKFNVPYSQISSVRYDDGNLIIQFKKDIGQVGDEISFEHMSGKSSNTRRMLQAYQELRPK